MNKGFLTYEQQLKNLQSKGLSISDADYAKKCLEYYSYSSLIGGYKHPFKHKPSGKYLYGVDFNEIVAFYNFDEELRNLFLRYILHIEKHIKSLYSYAFCSKYGEKQTAYLDKYNYNYKGKTNKGEISRLTSSLLKTISLPTQYKYIEHNINAYGNVPLWVAMNALTFGQVSKMYQFATTDIRSSISHHFTSLTEKQLHTFIRCLAKCRNICAHGERLYNFRSNEGITDVLLHKKLGIKRIKGHYVGGTNDLFSVVITVKYLLSGAEFIAFKRQLNRIITNMIKSCPHINSKVILKEMGFPENWSKISRFHKI